MAKSIRNHVDFMAGFRRQDLTFVFVKDLVQAIYLAIDKQVVRRSYFVTDGDVYSSRTFSDLIRKELGNPWMIRFICPLWLLKVISFVSERQIQNHEAAQLAVRHYTAGKGIGIPSGVSVGERCQRNNRLV